ncbi:hypothetical protein HZS55_18180 [Halosimplex rubrum]|uniref:DUF8154 domain-containing protein n=1 Tax=Halosimplex rubrum TaxID=869889 RepID=A0A7D5P267_9EURY|nr:hypothetical protein [Halosimplex rubrum]QLH79103.1 hypothetical protein HZS55_18180 [Halosimplex rubrum]
MDNSSIEDTLDAVLAEFRIGSGRPETGLEVDDPALLQLRKSCRMLETVRSLQKQNGYYTVIIEASFASIERSIQFYLRENGYIRDGEFVDHRKVYELGENAALYGTDFKEKLVQLWENNRSRTYYREGVGTEENARLMVDLAEQIHRHILQLASRSHECICSGD